METKILLRLIKDDILHLQGIADEFDTESMPTADEVELALFRANALLRQLELLHRSLLKKETLPHINIPKGKIKDGFNDAGHPVAEQKPLPVGVKPEDPPVSPPEEPIIINPVITKEILNTEEIGISPETPSETAFIQVDRTEENPLSRKTMQDDVLNESAQMVNELLSQEKSDSGYQIIPIRSIWDGIGINDRVLFVRELFENNSSKFELAVTELNQLATLQEAVNYLKKNFKWHKTDASKKFLVLVKRRFTN